MFAAHSRPLPVGMSRWKKRSPNKTKENKERRPKGHLKHVRKAAFKATKREASRNKNKKTCPTGVIEHHTPRPSPPFFASHSARSARWLRFRSSAHRLRRLRLALRLRDLAASAKTVDPICVKGYLREAPRLYMAMGQNPNRTPSEHPNPH